MTWPTLAAADYIALAGMLSAGLIFIFKFIQKIRTNDIRHLDEKIDSHNERVTGALARIEDKLDGHVRDHAAGVFK